MTHEHESPPWSRGRRGGGGPHRGGPFGRPGGWQQRDLPDASDATSWFVGRIPDGWFTGDLRVTVDRDEITVMGELPAPAPQDGDAAAAEGRITRWREETREQRMKIADEAQAKYGRSVAWGAKIGETGRLFTHLSVPAMTRLRLPARRTVGALDESPCSLRGSRRPRCGPAARLRPLSPGAGRRPRRARRRRK